MFWIALRRFLIQLFLIPWIFVWGGYGIYFIALRLAFLGNLRNSNAFWLLENGSNPDGVWFLFGISLFFSFLSYGFSFFLQTVYPRITTVAITTNLFLLGFLLVIQWEAVGNLFV